MAGEPGQACSCMLHTAASDLQGPGQLQSLRLAVALDAQAAAVVVAACQQLVCAVRGLLPSSPRQPSAPSDQPPDEACSETQICSTVQPGVQAGHMQQKRKQQQDSPPPHGFHEVRNLQSVFRLSVNCVCMRYAQCQSCHCVHTHFAYISPDSMPPSHAPHAPQALHAVPSHRSHGLAQQRKCLAWSTLQAHHGLG